MDVAGRAGTLSAAKKRSGCKVCECIVLGIAPQADSALPKKQNARQGIVVINLIRCFLSSFASFSSFLASEIRKEENEVQKETN